MVTGADPPRPPAARGGAGRNGLLGRRGRLLLGVALAGLAAFLLLELPLAALVPRSGGFAILREFLRGAVAPAFTYEAAYVPEGTPPLFYEVLDAARATLLFAAAGTSLALALGVPLAFLASTGWWPPARRGRVGPRVAHSFVRVAIAGMRSVHELLWAVLFLAAFGLTPFSAVVAIAIPYAGTFAKVFSEMLEECPRDSAESLRAIGARPFAIFAVGLVPRALPDACAYAFYRFECAVRSSAVLGFFGFPTLGYSIRLSADNLHYREVWTYLYALIALVLALELWSGALRRRLVIR